MNFNKVFDNYFEKEYNMTNPYTEIHPVFNGAKELGYFTYEKGEWLYHPKIGVSFTEKDLLQLQEFYLSQNLE